MIDLKGRCGAMMRAILGLAFAVLASANVAKADAAQMFKSLCQAPHLASALPDVSALEPFSAFDVQVLETSVGSSSAGWAFYWTGEMGGDYLILRETNQPPTCTLVSTAVTRDELEGVWAALGTGIEARGDEALRFAGDDDAFQATGFLAAHLENGVFAQTHLSARGSGQNVELYLMAVTLAASDAACALFPDRCE